MSPSTSLKTERRQYPCCCRCVTATMHEVNNGRNLTSSSRTLCISLLMMMMTCGFSNAYRTKVVCGPDAYYDPVVDGCTACADVCRDIILRKSERPCMNNCPAYYRRLIESGLLAASTMSTTSSLEQHDLFGQNLLKHPLLWTTFASLVIAATSVIVVVVLILYTMRQKMAGYTSVVGSASPTPTCSTSSVGPSPTLDVVCDCEKRVKSISLPA